MDDATVLSDIAETAYRAMIRNPGWDVDRLRRELGWSVEMTQAALDQLAEYTLVHRSGPDGIHLHAAPPQAALASVIADAEAELDRRQRRLREMGALIARVSAEADTSRVAEQVIRHDGVDSVRQRLAECMPRVAREVVSLNPSAAQPVDAKAASKPLNQELLERGVRIRSVYQDAFRNDPGLVGYATWITSLGGRLRTVPLLPTLLIIIDSTVAFVPIDADDSSRGALEVRAPGLVSTAYALFEQFWSAGLDVVGRAGPSTGPLPPMEQALLQLLAEGHTDDAAARRLGLSRRTVSRIVADLSEETGATSRFQLGAKASARGWLGPATGYVDSSA